MEWIGFFKFYILTMSGRIIIMLNIQWDGLQYGLCYDITNGMCVVIYTCPVFTPFKTFNRRVQLW